MAILFLKRRDWKVHSRVQKKFDPGNEVSKVMFPLSISFRRFVGWCFLIIFSFLIIFCSSSKICNWDSSFCCDVMKSNQVVCLKTIVVFMNSVTYRTSKYIFLNLYSQTVWDLTIPISWSCKFYHLLSRS